MYNVQGHVMFTGKFWSYSVFFYSFWADLLRFTQDNQLLYITLANGVSPLSLEITCLVFVKVRPRQEWSLAQL